MVGVQCSSLLITQFHLSFMQIILFLFGILIVPFLFIEEKAVKEFWLD